jgi:hypothetical protein
LGSAQGRRSTTNYQNDETCKQNTMRIRLEVKH